MDQFDPYHKWLGISPRDQPPNHYRLLGLDDFESDPDAIDAAAEQRAYFVRHCATGQHLAASQRMLSEISAARLCLLTPSEKTAYDAGMRERREPPVRASGASTETPQPTAGAPQRAPSRVSILVALSTAVAGLLAYRFALPRSDERAANVVPQVLPASSPDPGDATRVEPFEPSEPARIVFVPIPDQTIAHDERFAVQLKVVTFGHVGAIHYSLKNGPPGLVLDPDNGMLSWLPDGQRQPGEFRTVVSAASARRDVAGDRIELRLIVAQPAPAAAAVIPAATTVSSEKQPAPGVAPSARPLLASSVTATPPSNATPELYRVRGRSVADWITELKATYRANYGDEANSLLQRAGEAGKALVEAARLEPGSVPLFLREFQSQELKFRMLTTQPQSDQKSEAYLAADVMEGDPGNVPWRGVSKNQGISSKENGADYRLYAHDRNWNSAALFLMILQDAGSPAIPSLVDCLTDSSLRSSAVRGLALMPPADAMPHFVKCCTDQEAGTRIAGAWGLAAVAGYPRQSPDDVLRTLESVLGNLLTDSETQVADAAVAALTCLRTSQSAELIVPRMIAQLESGAAESTLTALAALGRHARAAGPALSAAVEANRINSLRGHEVWLAEAIGPTLAPGLLVLSRRGSREAFSALGAFGSETPRKVLDELVEALDDPLQFNRAYSMLRELGPHARPILPDLELLLERPGTPARRLRSLQQLVAAIKQSKPSAEP